MQSNQNSHVQLVVVIQEAPGRGEGHRGMAQEAAAFPRVTGGFHKTMEVARIKLVQLPRG